MRRRYTLALAGTAGTAAGLVWRAYRRDLDSAWARISHGSRLLVTRLGTMEYALAGTGAPLLVIHGAGGGFDQGLDLGHRFAEAGWQISAPSRFGYLRSDMPANASPAAQADAFVGLPDALGIERSPIMGVSAGGLSAVAFALRHPDRCSALVLVVPAAYVPGRPASMMSSPGLRLMRWALGSDLPFWTGTRFAESWMIEAVLGVDPALVRAAPPQERVRVRAILQGVLPVSARRRGLVNDGIRAGNPPPVDYGAIRIPTLAVSVEDDLYDTARNARHIASAVPGARLVIFPRGGHLFVEHDGALFDEVSRFLRGARDEEERFQTSDAGASSALQDRQDN